MDGSGDRDDSRDSGSADRGVAGGKGSASAPGASGSGNTGSSNTGSSNTGLTGSSGAGSSDTGGASAARTSKPPRGGPLYFFPDREVSAAELRRLLDEGPAEERAWAISHLLRYAQWDDIWTYVSRDEVREVFPELDLPDNLRQAWGRMLKVEAEVGTPG